ncbi:MAG: ABC transporter permease [Chitinophagaceae bacterium]|nr:ABC transporter permease [Chitinophagaceae bacterium]
MIIRMAWRNIWRNKMRSVAIALSVAIGLFAGISVLALYKGMMKSRVRTVIDSETGHLQIHHPEFKKDYDPAYLLSDPQKWIGDIRSFNTIKAAAVRTVTQAMLSTPTGSTGVQVNGIIPEAENEVSLLKSKIHWGDGFTGRKKNEVLVGKKLADKMKLKPGSKLVLTCTDTASDLVSAAFRVTGIYQTENSPLDERNVYVNRNDLNEMLNMDNSFHEIVVLLNNDEDLALAKQQLQERFPSFLVESWKEISPETELMVNTMDYYMYIIIGIIMLALAFGIINTMLMAILERTREIGMMVALGMSRFRLFLLVLLETVLLTITGTPPGLIAAWLAANYYNKKGIDISSFAGDTMSSFGFSSMIYPEFPGAELFIVLMIVITTALVSCIFPAIRAGRLQPVEALRK